MMTSRTCLFLLQQHKTLIKNLLILRKEMFKYNKYFKQLNSRNQT